MWKGEALHKLMGDGTTRVVPPPADRPKLIQDMHEQAGHFGVKRTAQLLLNTYWWKGITEDAAATVRRCQVCDRVRATFDAHQLCCGPCLSRACPIAGAWTCVGHSARRPAATPMSWSALST